jgi:hypothetical protein
VSGQIHAPAALPPGKEPPVPIGYEVGWTPEPVYTTWRSENSCPHRDSNSDPSAVQPVVNRYPGSLANVYALLNCIAILIELSTQYFVSKLSHILHREFLSFSALSLENHKSPVPFSRLKLIFMPCTPPSSLCVFSVWTEDGVPKRFVLSLTLSVVSQRQSVMSPILCHIIF